MKIIIVILQMLYVFSCGNEFYNGLQFELPHHFSAFSEAVKQIVEDFVVIHSKTVIITTACEDCVNISCINVAAIHTELVHTLSAHVGVVSQKYNHIISDVIQSEVNIFLIDNYWGFRQILDRMKPGTFKPNGFYLIIMCNDVSGFPPIWRILENCWEHSLINANILLRMVDDQRDEVSMYTFFPYTWGNCNKAIPKLYNRFAGNRGKHFWFDRPHFPDKMANMNLCNFTVATVQLSPHMLLKRNVSNDTISLDGIDGNLIRELQKRMNFTLITIVPSDGRGVAYANGTSSGCVGMVIKGLANMTIGGYAYSATRIAIMTASYPYYYSALIFVVPSGEPYSSLQKLFFPFATHIWLMLATMAVAAYVFDNLLKAMSLKVRHFLIGVGNRTPILNFFALFIGMSVHFVPRRNFAWCMFFLWATFSFVVRSSYQGALFDFLHENKFHPPHNTIEKMIKENFSFYMQPTSVGMFDLLPEVQKNIRLRQDTSLEFYDILRNKSFYGAILGTQENFAYYTMKHNPHVHGMAVSKDRIFLLQFAIYFRKNSYFVRPINGFINSFQANGMAKSWSQQFIDKSHLNQKRSKQATVAKLHEYDGLFKIYLYFMGLSGIVFVLEIFSIKCGLVKKILDFFSL